MLGSDVAGDVEDAEDAESALAGVGAGPANAAAARARVNPSAPRTLGKNMQPFRKGGTLVAL
jgi:hypothetical protein